MSVNSKSLRRPSSLSLKTPKNALSVKTPQRESIFKNIDLDYKTKAGGTHQLHKGSKLNDFTIESFGKFANNIQSKKKLEHLDLESPDFKEDLMDFLSKNEDLSLIHI